MALIISSSENTFEGAIVFHGEKDETKHYVYKVNKKSMYVGETEYKKMMDLWDKRAKGTTWKKFMERHQASMVNFGTWRISSEEAARKDSFEKINEKRKTQKAPMSKKGEHQVQLLYKRFLAGKGNYKSPSEIGNDRIICVLFDRDLWAVLNINGTQWIYDMKDNLYTVFNKEIHKDGKTVKWPTREYEQEEVVSQVV